MEPKLSLGSSTDLVMRQLQRVETINRGEIAAKGCNKQRYSRFLCRLLPRVTRISAVSVSNPNLLFYIHYILPPPPPPAFQQALLTGERRRSAVAGAVDTRGTAACA